MNENIFIQNVDLNVSIENITQIKTELSLPCFKNLETLKEAITHHYYSSKSSADYNKNSSLKNWLFALLVTHKELETCLIYGMAKKPSELYGQWYDNYFNQIFYDAPCSFFSNQSVSLSFTLVEKLAQFINTFKDIDFKITQISFAKLCDRKRVSKNGSYKDIYNTKNYEKYYNSNLRLNLLELQKALRNIAQIRHNKIHRMDSEIIKTNTSVYDGLINNEKPTKFIFSEIDTNQLPLTPVQILENNITFFREATPIIDQIFLNLSEEIFS